MAWTTKEEVKIKPISPIQAMNVVLEIRTRLKLTQKEFAKRLGVSRETVCKWEICKHVPNQDSWNRIYKLIKESREKG